MCAKVFQFCRPKVRVEPSRVVGERSMLLLSGRKVKLGVKGSGLSVREFLP